MAIDERIMHEQRLSVEQARFLEHSYATVEETQILLMALAESQAMHQEIAAHSRHDTLKSWELLRRLQKGDRTSTE
jgi:hypothetical protein